METEYAFDVTCLLTDEAETREDARQRLAEQHDIPADCLVERSERER